MEKTLFSPSLCGTVPAISSKSEAHRVLICAALSDAPTKIVCEYTNNDIDDTVLCLNSLGANILREGKIFTVNPIVTPTHCATLDCGESGSTLRFMIPIIAALGVNAEIYMHGRLPHRPLSPLYELLKENGVTLSAEGSNPLCVSGKLKSGDYEIAANVSSQFISGLLFALSLCEGDSTLTLTGKIQSKNYIDMTLDAQKMFGAQIEASKNVYKIKGIGKYISPGECKIMGDWSNAAFFLCAGAMSKNHVCVSGIDVNSNQGDKKIIDVLFSMGANIQIAGDRVTVSPSELLCGADIDAAQIPDLVPIIATMASVAEGKTTIYNAERLRLKESDRIESVCAMIQSLGGDITPTSDGMIIVGKKYLEGGIVDSFADHRIAMSAAISSTVCKNPVTIIGCEAVNKSYPDFFSHFDSINTKSNAYRKEENLCPPPTEII